MLALGMEALEETATIHLVVLDMAVEAEAL
jgi:hypothetical protein